MKEYYVKQFKVYLGRCVRMRAALVLRNKPGLFPFSIVTSPSNLLGHSMIRDGLVSRILRYVCLIESNGATMEWVPLLLEWL